MMRLDDVELSTAVPLVLARSSVVVVDDNADNVGLLERVLRAGGIDDIRTFTDPRAALDSLTHRRADLVLLDLHMPDLDGIGVMDELQRSVPPQTFLPVIVLTADITVEARQRVLAAGAKDFLTKPFDVTEVLLRTRNLLETSALYSRLQADKDDLQAELDSRAADDRAAAAERSERSRRIDQVLADHAVSIVYQPIVELATGRVVGAEALARFAGTPPRGPDAWFADATELGRGVELELAAISAAIDAFAAPRDVFLSVNASARTGSDPSLASLLGTSPVDMVLELTEHDPVEDYDQLLIDFNTLRADGVRIAVDDTGAGYAGLQHLLRLQAEILKLDITITRGIDRDPIRRSLAAALVAFGREIGAVVIAEGVEDQSELDTVRSLGVPWAQGYLLAKPSGLPIPDHVVLPG